MTDTMPADAGSQTDPRPAGDASPGAQAGAHPAFASAGFEKGQRVLLFNQETGQVDLPAEVNMVLDAPLKYGALDIPPGSVGVSSGDSAQIWWIRPELVGTMLRRVEGPPAEEEEEAGPEAVPESDHVSPGAALAPSTAPAAPAPAAVPPSPPAGAPGAAASPEAAPASAQQKVARAVEQESHFQAALGWISRSLGVTPWSAPTEKAAPAVPAPTRPQPQKPALVLQSRGDRAESVLMEGDDVLDECSPHMPEGPAPTTASGAAPDGGGFERGSPVDVWSDTLQAWESNGVVVDILQAPKSVNGVELPVGSVMVSFRGGMASKWVRPEDAGAVLRPARDIPSSGSSSTLLPAAATDQAAAAGQEFSVGDTVSVFSSSRKTWEDAEITDVLKDNVDTGSFQLPKGSVTVSIRGGAERHVIMPALFATMLRPAGTLPVSAGDSSEVPPSPDRASPLATQFVTLPQTAVAPGTGSMPPSPSDALDGCSLAPAPAPASTPDASPTSPAAAAAAVAATAAAAAALAPAPATGAPPALAAPTPAPTLTPAPTPAPATAPAPASAPAVPAATAAPVATTAGSAAGAPGSRVQGPEVPFDRRAHRVLVIGPGFGRELNPAQGQLLEQSGYQIRWVTNLPNPETPMFPAAQFLPAIKQAIDEFQPHCVAAASKGGAYLTALWQCGLWAGPSLVINRHPTLVSIPKGVSVVVCHGSNDEYYQFRREDLEALVRTGSDNRCLLYYTANSGLLGRGYTREGDRHNMQSLLQYDCLPRLVDAVLGSDGPEMRLMRSWDGMVTEERLRAEAWLGYSSTGLRRLWVSQDQKGMDEQVLFEVPVGSEEYAQVATIFKANPRVPRAYHDMNPGMWQEISILKMERVENGMQEDGSAEPYFHALQRGIENQGMVFRPGLHTRWAFHGSNAIESIVSNPISGFQPLMSGSRAQSLWGPGTYFARDAKYVYDGGFCRTADDGSRQILLCLLMTGMSCLGDPLHKGVLPMRQGRHRFNSSVDSLSNPEIWVTQSPGAAYPAYVITFA